MSLLGSVGPFDRDTDNWTSYCERLEQFFLANGQGRMQGFGAWGGGGGGG